MNKYIPIVIAVLSGIVYHISTKQTSASVNPFFSLAVTYGLAAMICLVCFYISDKDRSLRRQTDNVTWATYVLGISLPCLEFGWIMIYKVGWPISVSTVVFNIILTVILFAVGLLAYKEHAGVSRVAGLCLCICGIIVINI